MHPFEANYVVNEVYYLVRNIPVEGMHSLLKYERGNSDDRRNR